MNYPADASCRDLLHLSWVIDMNGDNLNGTRSIQAQRWKYRQELAIYEACHVSELCLEMGRDEVYGIWGGLLPAERRQLVDA